MRAPRFSIGSLLAMIAILGVALAALRSPSYLWANATFTVALLAMLSGVVNAIMGCGARRAYWLGFVLFGAPYLMICSVPGLRDTVCPRLVTEAIFDFIYPLVTPGPQAPAGPMQPTVAFTIPQPAPPVLVFGPGPTNSTSVTPMPAPVPSVPTGAFPSVAYNVVYAGLTAAEPPLSRWNAWTAPDRSVGIGYVLGTVSLVSSEAFRQIGHSLTALLLATVGAVFARNRYEANAVPEHTATEPAPGAESEPSLPDRPSISVARA